MKIFVLLRHVDHEGSDVLACYRDRAVAEAWKQWCYEHNSAIRDSIGESGGMYDREWKLVFGPFPGDFYSVEEHDTRAAMPSNAKTSGPTADTASTQDDAGSADATCSIPNDQPEK